jgi:hypothetical protein
MTWSFDPTKTRFYLINDLGIQRDLAADFEEVRANKSLGGYAHGFLLDAIQCLLVGLDMEGQALLEKAIAWHETAICTKEVRRRYIPFITEAERFHDLALCRWLLGREGVMEALTACLESLDAYYAGQPRWADYDELYVAVCIEASAYTKGIEFWETTAAGAGFRGKETSQDVCDVAYAICRAWATGNTAEARDSSWKVLGPFLERNVPAWLADGQYPTAAQWMKIAYCHLREPALPPMKALLQCYAFLPGIAPPQLP